MNMAFGGVNTPETSVPSRKCPTPQVSVDRGAPRKFSRFPWLGGDPKPKPEIFPLYVSTGARNLGFHS